MALCIHERQRCDCDICPETDKLRAEVARLREALENAAEDGHRELCATLRLYRGCTCHQAETLKTLGMACATCDGAGAIEDSGERLHRCGACDGSGRAALATAKAKGG